MKLYVMRHGPAEEQSASGVDSDRALTSQGREKVRAVAKALLDEGEEPVNIITSPLVRAVQTAEIVAIVTRVGDRAGSVSARRELAPGGAADVLSHRLAAEGSRRVMFVGHEPDLSSLVSTLLGARFTRGFDKAMVIGLHIASSADEPARLRFVLEPKTLRLEPAPAP
jgi:phosphohistidine phosphatase